MLPRVYLQKSVLVIIGVCCGDDLQEVIKVYVRQYVSKDGALWSRNFNWETDLGASIHCYQLNSVSRIARKELQ